MIMLVFEDKEYAELMECLEWVRRNCTDMRRKSARDELAYKAEWMKEMLTAKEEG